MGPMVAAISVIILALLAFLAGSTAEGQTLIGLVAPYAAGAVFLVGLCWRVVLWARSPVPFRIPTSCGQQTSLSWIKPARLENPSTTAGVVGRLALEILLFRSLFRNQRAELHQERYVYGDNASLWLGALLFHWALLAVLLRHLRLLVLPVPRWILGLDAVDGFLQLGAPVLYLSDVLVLVALGFLLLRRLRDPRLRYISQFSDYFALFLLLAIAGSGAALRYSHGVDVVAVKRLALGLVSFRPLLPAGLSPLFMAHLLLVCTLAVYFPFSKLMHVGGAVLSPTRNLANTSRMRRHINPWNRPVKTHTYAEWQEEFRDKIVKAGIPLDEDRHV
jgi:[DsrC]-trisulfide reductase subunit M